MSKSHGDKARFHRLRKQSIARRLKVRELRKQLALAQTRARHALTGEPNTSHSTSRLGDLRRLFAAAYRAAIAMSGIPAYSLRPSPDDRKGYATLAR